MEALIRFAMVPASMARTPRLRQVVAAFRNQRADAADLHADGAEVGEAAQRECGDGERTRRERGLLRAQADVGDDFVERHARAEQVADGARVVPGHADEPRDRSEDKAENLAEARREPGQAAMDPGEQHVEQRDQGQERNQHDGHVHGQLAAVDGAAGNGADEILFLVLLALGNDDAALGVGDVRFPAPASWP